MDTNQRSAGIILKTRLCNKLHPDNFPQMTGKMAAVLGYVLDVPFVQPRITAITVSTDGCLSPTQTSLDSDAFYATTGIWFATGAR